MLFIDQTLVSGEIFAEAEMFQRSCTQQVRWNRWSRLEIYSQDNSIQFDLRAFAPFVREHSLSTVIGLW